MLREARGTVAAATGTADAARVAVEALTRCEHELQQLLRESTALASGVRGPAQTALAGLRTALDEMRGLARQIKLAPDSLLFGVRPAAPAGGER